MQKISTEEMIEAIQQGMSDPHIQQQMNDANEAKSRAEGTIGGYVRDWGLIMLWTGLTSGTQLSEKIFFIIMERFVGVYSVGRVENFRSAVAWRQNLDRTNDRSSDQWSQKAGFKLRFDGYLKRVETLYREKQAAGLIPSTKRGHIKGEKVDDLFQHCKRLGEIMYAVGLVLCYHLLLRHADVVKLDETCLRHSPARGWEAKIVGGKGRPFDFIEWINADDAPDLCAALLKKTPKGALLFPRWSEDRANELIRGAADQYGWVTDGEKYVQHCLRRGGARDLYDSGMSIPEICVRGRWKSARMAKGYIGQT